jgi:predicted TIM-barrel fold metal-dependent hydrolase
MKYVDTHTHAISADLTTYPLHPVGDRQSTWSQQRPVTIEQLLATMDAAGIDQAVLVHASTAYGYDNSYAADSLVGREDRFVGVCAVDFFAETACKDLAYWIDQRHFSGVRLKSLAVAEQFQIFRDPRAEPVWGEVQDRQIPVCVSLDSAGIEPIRDLLRRFPRLRILVDHGGNPDIAGGPPYPRAAGLFGLREYEGVYMKLTSVTFERVVAAGGDAHNVVRAMVDQFGSDRLMWGTNFPATAGSMPELLTRAQEAFADLSTVDQQAIFATTARSVYPALGTSE